jgi:hypothetical protein
MTWGWQDVATLLIVISAMVYLARKVVPGLAPKRAGGCAHCPSKNGSGSCQDQPVMITLTGLRASERKSSEFGA